jgi:hypothetical protein
MQSKILVVLGAAAILGGSSTAMARGGGAHGMHGHFAHHFNFHNFRFGRNPLFLSGFGWGDWGLGPYDNSGGGSNTTVVVFPQAIPRAANVTGNVTGSVDPPCHWNQEEFTVPSSAGGTRPIQVVSCR